MSLSEIFFIPMYAICNLAQIPLRKEPSHAGEMISQVLFGETVCVEKHENEWSYVRLTHDGYQGWVLQKQIEAVDENFFITLKNRTQHVVADTSIAFSFKNEEKMILPQGSYLPLFFDNKFRIGNEIYFVHCNTIEIPRSFKRENIINYALSFLNTPYLWGGRSLLGIDCSGLVQVVYKWCGMQLPRDAYQQVEMGETINFISEAQEGDLAFFENDQGKIIHVGIIMKGNKIIHASGKVRIDSIDHHGIFNEQMKEYTHNLRTIKRV